MGRVRGARSEEQDRRKGGRVGSNREVGRWKATIWTASRQGPEDEPMPPRKSLEGKPKHATAPIGAAPWFPASRGSLKTPRDGRVGQNFATGGSDKTILAKPKA